MLSKMLIAACLIVGASAQLGTGGNNNGAGKTGEVRALHGTLSLQASGCSCVVDDAHSPAHAACTAKNP